MTPPAAATSGREAVMDGRASGMAPTRRPPAITESSLPTSGEFGSGRRAAGMPVSGYRIGRMGRQWMPCS